MRMRASAINVTEQMDALIDAWCERRALGPLRIVLHAYPLPSPLTDSWVELASALDDVHAFVRDDLTPAEATRLDRVTGEVYRILRR